MSFSSSYLEKRKKRLKEREKQLDNKLNNDIAPVGGNKDSWFKGGALSDGYEFGDITKTILGTAGDAGLGIVKGATRMVEGIADVATYGVAGVADLFGADSFAEDARDVAKFSATDEFTAPVTDYVDKFSLLGNKADSVSEGLGQVGTILLTGGAAGAAGLGSTGVTAVTTGVTGLSSMGSGMSQAYTEGATDEEALTYGLISGVAEAGTELLFGGLGKAVGAVGLSKGISSLDDALAKKVSSKIANQTMKNFAEFGIKAGAEGTEEVISGILQAFGKKATYMSEEELGKLLKDENLLDSFIVGTITSGIAQSGIVPGMKKGSLIEANKQGADFITGHTETEQKVIDRVVESNVAEKEKELGRKLKAKERAEIEEDVETKLIKGGISIDTIEETLGGDSYKAYKEATEKQEALKKELNELRNMKKGEMTDIQTDRLTELKAMDLEDTSKVDELKAKASQDVFELIKADRKGQGSILAESYNERERRGVAFEVDTNKVDSKKADTYKRAMEAGVLNNTNATHDFVDLVATLEAEKGVKIDFSNNEKLKASGFAVDGAEVNGVKTNGGIILNANSRKNLNVVVGHEITHILEGTELYTALKDTIISYAKSKGDYDARYKATSKLYEKVKDADIDGEITADLVGEYLFTDEKFIKNLTTNKNLFKKVYDEIKYLVKVATAGSAEKKQLLKVQRAFEKAFESSKTEEKATKNTANNSGAKYSLSDTEIKLNKALSEYPYNMQTVIEEYIDSVDKAVLAFVKKYIDNPKADFGRQKISNVSEKQVNDIAKLTRIDVSGYTNAINKNGIIHIDKRHGVNGIADNSMSNPLDIARIGYVLENYDNVKVANDGTDDVFSTEFMDSQNKPSPMLVYNKRINGTYYVVQAIPESKYKKLWVVSAYINKNGQVTQALANESGMSPVSPRPNSSIPQNTDSVNREFSENQKKTDSDNVGYYDKVLFSLSEMNSSDRDSEGNVLSAEQQEYFKDSKVRDSEGKLLPVYHGSPSVFTEFSHNYMGQHGSAEGQGFYFTDKKSMAEGYKREGGQLLAGYLDIKKPLSDSKITLKRTEVKKLIETLDPTGDDVVINYDPMGGVDYPSRAWYTRSLNATVDSVMKYSDTDSEILADIANSGAGTKTVVSTIRELFGYDGYIVTDKYEGASVYVAFESNQFKNADNKTPTSDPDIRYSLSEIVAEDGTSYGIGVKLDSTLLDNLEPKDRISLVKEYVRELQGKVFTAFDEDGEPVDISIAEGNKRFRNSNGNRVATNKDLTTKHISKETKQEAIALIDELVSAASYQGSEAARHPHDWLDNDGNNEWDRWTTYIQDKNNTIWEATLHIANTTNGEKILYDISLIKKAEQSGKSDTSLLTLGQSGESDTIPDDDSIAPLPENVKRDAKFSLSDAEDIAPVDNIVDNVDIAPIANKYSDIEEQIKANQEKLDSLMAEYDEIANMLDNGEMSVTDFEFRSADITKEYDDTKRRIDALTYELTEIEKNNITVTDAIKNYSKKDALVVVERMGAYDLTKAARKRLADALWEGMNKNTTVEQRETFAKEFAKTATETIVEKSRTENPNYNSAKEQLPYIASGIGRLTFTADDMAELKYKYDKDLKKFLGRWGYKGGTNADGTSKRRYPMSQFVIDYARETAGMSHLEDMHHAEAMFEIDELYEDLSAEVKNRWVNSYEQATKEEIESLKADIERTVLEAFETEGRDARVKKGLEAAYDKIDKQFEADKASLDKAFEKSKENALAMSNDRDRSAYIASLEERYAMRLAELTEQVKREKELAKKESERVRRKDLHNSIIEAIKTEYTTRGLDFDEVLDKAKRKGNFASVDNTPQRFIEKTLGYKEGQILNDLTVNKIALNESAGIKWLNGQVDNIRKLSKKYNIKPGSKESAAAQMYGEGFYVNKEGEYIKYGDAELAKDFPSIEVQNNIKALAKNSDVRRMYDETLDAINASRVRNGYPEIPKRADYFLHFRAMDDTFSRLGIPFNPNDIKAKDLPTDINGMTADLKPGQPYFASANKRMGINTTYDLLGGIERYMNSAKNQIYHIDDIQTLRAVRNYVADRYGQANGLNDLDSMTPDEQEARIKDVYDGHLSTFAKFLNEEANIIAGKTSLMDRSVEGIFGRRAMQVLNTINSQVGKNMVGFNIGSAGTNFLPLVQAAAKLRKSDMIKAFSQTISNKFNSDGFVENDPTLIRRKGADKFSKNAWEKASDIGYVLMSAVDNLTSEVIVRAKYNELTRNGLDSEQAHIKAGEWASRLMGDRSLGQMPQLFNSKTLGIFTKFQLEVRNQLDSMFYDSFQEAKESTENIENATERNAKTAAKVASTLAQLFVFQHIFGMVYEQIAGYNPTFDILSTLATLFGWDDEEESEDAFGDNLQQAFNELLDDLPYSSLFTGGGRIPISAALPIEEVLTGKDEWGNEVSRLETIAEAAPYYFLPTGYGQFKKTRDGLNMFSDEHPIAGSYTDSGNLRFPVEETPLNIAQAAVFGQYANKNAREYFDNDYAPLTPNQVEEFMATGMSYSEYSKKKKAKKIKEAKAKELIYSLVGGEDLYREYTDALSEIKAGVYVDRRTRVLGYLNSLDIDYVTKLILYKKQFPNDNRFNVALVNNLNERDDISYSEMEAILTELGFQVDEDGNIKW